MNMNKKTISSISEKIAIPLAAISSPPRIAILLAIGTGEACVCHLETALSWRQAYISQHLMALRKADILFDRREGRYVFYRLKNPALLELIKSAALLIGITPESITRLTNQRTYPACECPHCVPSIISVESLKPA